ncbi:YhhA family cyclophane-containing RiPP [Delftia tsuruhatensis]|uniref:YhhA family cyclophane-containing RiPP n=1 Tax=Delftia tsuruhatensis TaxID=180282 RepID=UPI0028A92E38|nr:YhhA family cyclophane-containing RiPP [Delftia tsuruhatensis]
MSLYDTVDFIDQPQEVMRDAVKHVVSDNPAIQRLKARVLAETKPSEVISSFDRMHHRHNRS